MRIKNKACHLSYLAPLRLSRSAWPKLSMSVTVSTLQDRSASRTAARIGPAHIPLTPGTEILF